MSRVRFRITGDEQVIRQLRQVERNSNNLSPSLRKTGNHAVRIAKSLVSFSQQLQRSVTFDTNRRSRLTLVAGGSFVWVESLGVWGAEYHNGSGRRREEGPRPFLEIAAKQSANVARNNMEDQISSIIRRAGLS